MPVALGGPDRKDIPRKHVATDAVPAIVDWPRAVGANAQFGTGPARNGPALIAHAYGTRMAIRGLRATCSTLLQRDAACVQLGGLHVGRAEPMNAGCTLTPLGLHSRVRHDRREHRS